MVPAPTTRQTEHHQAPEDLATFPLWEKDEEPEYNENDIQEMRELIRKKNEEAGVT